MALKTKKVFLNHGDITYHLKTQPSKKRQVYFTKVKIGLVLDKEKRKIMININICIQGKCINV